MNTFITHWNRFWNTRRIQEMFPTWQQERISSMVAEAEQKTTGEIRVVIRACLEDGVKDVKTQAISDFNKYGVDRTRMKNGVLLLIVIKERKFYILGDEGINALVPEHFWEDEIQVLRDTFTAGTPLVGIALVIQEIRDVLNQYFPKQYDDTDELPNHPIVEV